MKHRLPYRMIRTLATAGLLSLTCLTACSGAGAEPRPPHIVILLADDLGWNDVGYHGSDIATPHLDELASEGMRLERFYATPICTPTRASLMTGGVAARFGLIGNLRPHDTGGLPLEASTLPRHLKRAGYDTALVGKWHLGHAEPEQWPGARGFDHSYGHLGGYIDYYTHMRDDVLDWQRNGEQLVENGYSTRLIAREAARVINRHDPGRPLFLYVAFNAPHYPLQPGPSSRGALTDTVTAADKRTVYANMVEELDRAVGMVLEGLERKGMATDTFLLFASDNGASERHGGSNDPLRAGKYTTYEGGIRVPAILRWSEAPTDGRTFDQVLSVQDLVPTLAALTGFPAAEEIEGENLLAALRSGEARSRGDLHFAVQRQKSHRYALLRSSHKLVYEISDEDGSAKSELFDLLTDPGEEHDLSADEPELARQLIADLEAWINRHGARASR